MLIQKHDGRRRMAGNWSRPVTELEAARVAADIDRQGYGVLSNYVSEEELAAAHALALAAVEAAGGEYFCFMGPDALAGTVRAVQRCWVGCIEPALSHMRGEVRRLIARGVCEPENV